MDKEIGSPSPRSSRPTTLLVSLVSLHASVKLLVPDQWGSTLTAFFPRLFVLFLFHFDMCLSGRNVGAC